MKFYSNETMRQHAQDLTKELKVKQMPEALRYFINNTEKGKEVLSMYNIANRFPREWAAVGLLDLHDIAQECYCALIRAYNRVNWDSINKADNPQGQLWSYLKTSILLDARIAINTFKDGMRIPRNKIWEAKKKTGTMMNDFFSIPYPQLWFWENDETLNLSTESISRFDVEQLYDGLQNVMRLKLNDTERQVLEMSFGIDEHLGKKRTFKEIANVFHTNEPNIRKIKQRALKKLRSEEVESYLENFYEYGSQS